MKDFWKKHKLWINIAFYLLLAAALFLLAIRPLLNNIREKSDEIQKISIDNQVGQERIAKLPEMREMHSTFDQEKNNLNVVLDQNNSVDFIRRLELLAQETGNRISLKIDDNLTSLNNSKDTRAKKDKKVIEDIISNLPSDRYISMEITLEGRYENFILFLHKLENLDYYVNVLSLSLIKETIDQGANGYQINSGKEEGVSLQDILVSSIRIIVYIK